MSGDWSDPNHTGSCSPERKWILKTRQSYSLRGKSKWTPVQFLQQMLNDSEILLGQQVNQIFPQYISTLWTTWGWRKDELGGGDGVIGKGRRGAVAYTQHDALVIDIRETNTASIPSPSGRIFKLLKHGYELKYLWLWWRYLKPFQRPSKVY